MENVYTFANNLSQVRPPTLLGKQVPENQPKKGPPHSLL